MKKRITERRYSRSEKSHPFKKKIKLPSTILNLGGIANITSIDKKNKISSGDIGPGNCLIDNWVRLNSKQSFDEGGNLAKSGKV
ncbi:MAG: anhydro-N-acetylmuramic acid kinase, partial [Candidatus Nitrosopelagicus sp.]|nr:anhydro-N-acetylmuramic acid kinase [Candidatus Nitrosopelagicus sp.]